MVIHRGVHNCGISRYAAFFLGRRVCVGVQCVYRAARVGRVGFMRGFCPASGNLPGRAPRITVPREKSHEKRVR